MGECAKYRGHSIKIGTCENMYYLRYDQRNLVEPEAHSLNPADESIIGEIRFRFPFPQEDKIEPGGFDDYNYGVSVPGSNPLFEEILNEVAHASLQFTRNYPRSGGILLSTPCPESKEGKASGLRFGYNGYAGKIVISQQRRIGTDLWTVCECGSCGAKFRLPFEEAEKLAVILRSEADRDPKDGRSAFYHTIADRMLAGYSQSKEFATA